MSTKEKESTEKKGKKAEKDAPPVNIGWDSHQAVVCFQREFRRQEKDKELLFSPFFSNIDFLLYN